MREIKFRAWDGKYMVNADYGDWLSFNGIPYTQASEVYDTPNIEIEKAKDYILMQYTGLKDKNGVDIYEGDIYSYQGEIGVFKSITDFYFQELIEYRVKNGEIIGNIYENPDLIS